MDDDRSLGVGTCRISEFYEDLSGRIALMSMSDVELDELCDDKSQELGEVVTPQFMRHAARRPILVIGDPGVGKTCGIIAAINEHNTKVPKEQQWGFKKILLGQTIVGALQGIPVVDTSTHQVIRAEVPDLPNEARDGKYGILFLDEITTADEAQVQPALGLADDTRNIGTYTLPENWLVVAAGNGPNCANFKVLHDMTLSRFACYNVYCDYAGDWRPWAREHGVDPLILAYLNFKSEDIVHIASNALADPDVGKAFATPRTWTRLSDELKLRKLCGRPVTQSELYSFSSRIIGEEVGNRFASFAAFRSSVKFDAKKIVEGTEVSPRDALRGAPMRAEEFHILLQGIMSQFNVLYAGYSAKSVSEDTLYTKIANAVRWIIDLSNCQMLDMVITTFAEMSAEIPAMRQALVDDAFTLYCPEFERFFSENQSLVNAIKDSLAKMSRH